MAHNVMHEVRRAAMRNFEWRMFVDSVVNLVFTVGGDWDRWGKISGSDVSAGPVGLIFNGLVFAVLLYFILRK